MNQENYTYILIFLLVISFTLNPFIKKKSSIGLEPSEYMIINHCMISILTFTYFAFLIYNNKCDINCFNKPSKEQYIWAGLGAITSVAGALLLIMLIQRDEVSFIIPNVQAAVIFFGTIIGYYFFNENINNYKIFGIIFLVSGVLLINYGKKITKLNN